MEWLNLLAELIRLVAGMYLTFSAVFTTKDRNNGIRFGVGLLLLGSVGGF